MLGGVGRTVSNGRPYPIYRDSLSIESSSWISRHHVRRALYTLQSVRTGPSLTLSLVLHRIEYTRLNVFQGKSLAFQIVRTRIRPTGDTSPAPNIEPRHMRPIFSSLHMIRIIPRQFRPSCQCAVATKPFQSGFRSRSHKLPPLSVSVYRGPRDQSPVSTLNMGPMLSFRSRRSTNEARVTRSRSSSSECEYVQFMWKE